MDIKLILKRLGLPKHAYNVYANLQKSGPQHIAGIANQINVHRPAVYKAIRELLKHDFIFCAQVGKSKLYQVKSPSLIIKKFKDVSKKIATISERDNIIEEYIENHTRFLKGRIGIQKVFDDVINHEARGNTFYRYTSEKDLDLVNQYLSKDYRKKRDAKKLERLVISNPQSGERKKPRLERFIKYIRAENSVFDHNIIQIIYGKRVAFIDLNVEEAIIIENKALAEFQKVIFRQLYKKL